MELLAEAGWPAVTARAIADRSGANPGLIHYHYGGLPQLHRAIAARAVASSIRPMAEQLMAADDLWPGVAAVIRAAAEQREETVFGRLVSELVVGSLRDDDIRWLVRDELRRARAQLATWVAGHRPSWSPEEAAGVAIAITGLLDGLVLQNLIDDDLDLHLAATGLARALGGAD